MPRINQELRKPPVGGVVNTRGRQQTVRDSNPSPATKMAGAPIELSPEQVIEHHLKTMLYSVLLVADHVTATVEVDGQEYMVVIAPAVDENTLSQDGVPLGKPAPALTQAPVANVGESSATSVASPSVSAPTSVDPAVLDVPVEASSVPVAPSAVVEN